MRNVILLAILALITLTSAGNCRAAQVKVYVSLFSISGSANREELRTTLQTLLMSRLSSDSIVAVESETNADITISGSYLAFGKVFSIDASARSRGGAILIRAFEQGEGQEEMLPAVGKLSKTLASGINTKYTAGNPLADNSPMQLTPGDVSTSPSADIIRSQPARSNQGSGWISQKLPGEMTGIALGRKLGEKGREIFITGNNSLHYYLLGKELTLQAQISLPASQKILGVDSADLDSNGIPEIYLTVMNGDDVASQIWVPEDKSLRKSADNLPYFFRAIAFQGKGKKLYAQQQSHDNDYYGDLFEVRSKGTSIEVLNPVKLPRGANIFNINMLPTKDGKGSFIVLNQDGYLLVYNENGKIIWKSSDKYGGTENFFSREDMQEMRVTGSPYRRTFIEQRLIVTRGGSLLVPKNEGSYNIGNSRSYSKNAVHAFTWNGVMLDELWHTKQSQNYLADYLYDEENKELILLEVVMKEGILDQGASAVSIKKVE